VVIGCIIGFTNNQKYITAANAKAGDSIILTKSAGIEGTAILASDKEEILHKKINIKRIKKAKNFFKEISVVREALIAYKTGGVNAMHDPTEGGIIGGIHEMADASKLGFKIYKDRIPVRIETSTICEFLKIDPLQLISSGALLISTNPKYSNEVLKRLHQEGIPATIIGKFLSNSSQRIIKLENNEELISKRSKSDHLWKALQL
jgi:hydrogenase maturation factor